ncbi:MAG TPA: hypothetical protein DEO49_08150 [Sutterella sp.]|nr:hypothetical protein [Sutterella sp.]
MLNAPIHNRRRPTTAETNQRIATTALPPNWMTENIPLNLFEVLRIVGLSREYVYARIRRMEFPKPFKVSNRRVRWWSQDVVSYLNGKREGWTEREQVVPVNELPVTDEQALSSGTPRAARAAPKSEAELAEPCLLRDTLTTRTGGTSQLAICR